jgi:hypothetical protein
VWQHGHPHYNMTDSLLTRYNTIQKKINDARKNLFADTGNSSDKAIHTANLVHKSNVQDISLYEAVNDYRQYIYNISDTLPAALSHSLQNKICLKDYTKKTPARHSLLALACLENRVLTSFLYTCFYTIERAPDVGYIDHYMVHAGCYPDSSNENIITDVSLIGWDTSKQPVVLLKNANSMDTIPVTKGQAVIKIAADTNDINVQGVMKYPKYDYYYDIPFSKHIKIHE